MIIINIEEIYSINGGESLLNSSKAIRNEINEAFSNASIKLQRGETREIKKYISDCLNKKGWADEIKIEPSHITINFLKRKVGLCVQLGNVARIYADLLKIQLMYEKKLIDVGVIAVPMKSESKSLGSNHAQFERLIKELKMFANIINLPLVIIGLS